MEDKEIKLGAIVYTDGSANNMLKIWGWGAHGYIFDLLDETGVTKNKAIGVTVSNIGYLESGELKIRPHTVVNPIQYLDWYGAYDTPGTNNIGELLGILEPINKLIDMDIKDIKIYTDSRYAMGAFETAGKKNVEELKRDTMANLDLLLKARILHDKINANDIKVEILKIKAHNGHIGNMIADDMAMLGRVESSRRVKPYIDFTLREPKGYWKPKNERHPFLNAKQIFFTNSDPIYEDGSMEYSLLGYKEENEIGKKMHAATYNYVVLKQKDEVIELIKNTYNTMLGKHSVVSTIRMDLLFKPDNFKYVDRYGAKSLMPIPTNRKGITVLEKDIVANAVNPPALAYTALENINLLRLILKDYNNLKANAEHKTAKEFIDITDLFYTEDEKGRNVVRPEFNTEVKNITFKYEKDGKTADLIIQLGKDVITRNQLKKIEKEKPQVKLCIMNNRNIKLDYFTVIDMETTGDQMVCSNYYTKTVFLK